MYSNIGLRRYRETDISSMSREKIIVLLYEKMVSDLNEALSAIADGRRVDMTKRINHSQRIVTELRSALNHDVGGDIARNLDSLYDFLFHEHLQVLVDQDPAHVHNCLGVIAPLLDAWRKVPAGAAERETAAGANPAGNAEHAGTNHQGGQTAAPVPETSSLLSVSA